MPEVRHRRRFGAIVYPGGALPGQRVSTGIVRASACSGIRGARGARKANERDRARCVLPWNGDGRWPGRFGEEFQAPVELRPHPGCIAMTRGSSARQISAVTGRSAAIWLAIHVSAAARWSVVWKAAMSSTVYYRRCACRCWSTVALPKTTATSREAAVASIASVVCRMAKIANPTAVTSPNHAGRPGLRRTAYRADPRRPLLLLAGHARVVAPVVFPCLRRSRYPPWLR